MSATFTLALTVLDDSSADDVLIRGNAEQTIGELAQRLAAYIGRPTGPAYGLRVERTGEQLRPDSPLSSVDLLEGDRIELLIPNHPPPRRRPRWADDDSATPFTVIPLRPRSP